MRIDRHSIAVGLALALLFVSCNGTPVQVAVFNERWESRAPLPDARTEVSVTTDGQRLYVIGGFGQGGGAPRPMHVYDPGADAWSTPGPIPEGVNHAGLVHLNGKLYIVGGFREDTFEPTAALRIYDLATRVWSNGPPLPTARGALAAVVLNGRIHAIGGNAANAGSLNPAEHNIARDQSSVGTHEVYDPATNTWSRLAPMRTARNHLGAAVVDGNIHAVGGRVADDFTMTAHEVYDVAANTWTNAPALPTGRSGIATVAHDGRVYVFGGETFGGVQKTFEEAERFNVTRNNWEALPPMPTPRHGLGAAAIANTIYVISGGPQPGFAFSTANEALIVGN
jgi:N-acetylneuraminic acid mutarotase